MEIERQGFKIRLEDTLVHAVHGNFHFFIDFGEREDNVVLVQYTMDKNQGVIVQSTSILGKSKDFFPSQYLEVILWQIENYWRQKRYKDGKDE